MLVFLPTIIVQIFSMRWHIMDSQDIPLSRCLWIVHSILLGVIQRYITVIGLYNDAIDTQDETDFKRFYQQQSDVCMLRLFDAFTESAPQLVFHLYVLIVKSDWTNEQAAWTGISAVASVVSLGWGITAYSSAMRMIRADKAKLSWAGMTFQTLWRAGMLTARVVSLVILALVLRQWALIVICKFS